MARCIVFTLLASVAQIQPIEIGTYRIFFHIRSMLTCTDKAARRDAETRIRGPLKVFCLEFSAKTNSWTSTQTPCGLKSPSVYLECPDMLKAPCGACEISTSTLNLLVNHSRSEGEPSRRSLKCRRPPSSQRLRNRPVKMQTGENGQRTSGEYPRDWCGSPYFNTAMFFHVHSNLPTDSSKGIHG